MDAHSSLHNAPGEAVNTEQNLSQSEMCPPRQRDRLLYLCDCLSPGRDTLRAARLGPSLQIWFVGTKNRCQTTHQVRR